MHILADYYYKIGLYVGCRLTQNTGNTPKLSTYKLYRGFKAAILEGKGAGAKICFFGKSATF